MTERDLIHAGWAAWDDGPKVSFSTQWSAGGQEFRVQVTAIAAASEARWGKPGWHNQMSFWPLDRDHGYGFPWG